MGSSSPSWNFPSFPSVNGLLKLLYLMVIFSSTFFFPCFFCGDFYCSEGTKKEEKKTAPPKPSQFDLLQQILARLQLLEERNPAPTQSQSTPSSSQQPPQDQGVASQPSSRLPPSGPQQRRWKPPGRILENASAPSAFPNQPPSTPTVPEAYLSQHEENLNLYHPPLACGPDPSALLSNPRRS